MSADIIYVGFQNSRIAIQTDLDLARVWIERRFRSMITLEAGNVIATVRIVLSKGVFRLLGDCDDEAPNTELANTLERGSYEIARNFIAAHPQYLWIHASAVSKDDQAVLFPGSWGRGKSTMAVSLAKKGWFYISDDLLPMDPATGEILPFPRMPTTRKSTDRALPRQEVPEVPKAEWTLGRNRIADGPTPVAVMVFPRYDFTTGESLTPCGPAEAVVELLSNCVNFDQHGGAGVAAACRLLERVPAFRLTYSRAEEAADLIRAHHNRSVTQTREKE